MELSGLLQRFYELCLDIIASGNRDRFAHYTYEIRVDGDKYYDYVIPSDKYAQYTYNRALLNKYAISSVFVYGLPFICIGHNYSDITIEPIYDASNESIKAIENIKEILLGMKEFEYQIYRPNESLKAIDVGYLTYEYNNKAYDATLVENREDTNKELKEVIKYNKDIMQKRLNYLLNLSPILKNEFNKLISQT